MTKLKEKIIKEFEKKFTFGQTTEEGARIECDAKWLKDFLSQTISQVREETKKEIINKIMEEFKHNGKWHWVGYMSELEKWEKDLIEKL